jgi:hypothetical protein
MTMSEAAPRRQARPFVAMFVATLSICALAGFNLWPFSSWELFSRLRTDQQTGWDVVGIDSSGRTRDDPIAALPYGHRGFAATMAAFSDRSPSTRDAICDAWLSSATEELGSSTRFVEVFHLRWELSDRQAPRKRELALVCSERVA